MNKSLKKLISCLLIVVTLSFGLSPKVNADGEVHYLAFASDYYNIKGSIYNAMKSMPESVEYVSLIGDMYGDFGGDHPEYESSEILGYVKEVFPNLNNSNVSIIWADHDASVNDENTGIVKCKDGYESGVIYTGYNSDNSVAYYIYGVGFYHMLNGGDTSKNAADAFKTWVSSIDTSIPIIVLCHAPMQALRGDNNGAIYWDEALNYAATGTAGIDTTEETGTITRDVFFFHGHNHTEDKTEYFFPAGSVMSVQVDKSSEQSTENQGEQPSKDSEESKENQDEQTNNSSEQATGNQDEQTNTNNLNEQNEQSNQTDQNNLSSPPPEKPDGQEPPFNDGERPSGPLNGGGKREPEGQDSNIYYNVLTVGYLKTSGNATLMTISDNKISLEKYNGDDLVSLGTINKETNKIAELAVVSGHVTHVGYETVIENLINPTCTDSGSYDEVVYCADENCGIELRRNHITTNALGHDMSSWAVTTEPTVDSYGEETRYCSRCSCHETRAIAPLTYIVTKGTGNTWTQGSSSSSTFTIKHVTNDSETFDHFEGIYVDGDWVDPGNYTAERGSVIIKLNPSYLDTLEIGPHILTAVFDNGNNPSVNFFIQDKYRIPTTGIELDN